jgi:nucleotide-binding universal stress UspA family protein
MDRDHPGPRLVSYHEKETDMTLDNRSRRIVVGYDGSPASRAALALAAERTGADGKLYVVHAYTLPHDWIGTPDYQLLLDVVLDRAQACVKPLDDDLQGIDFEAEVIADRPAHAIAGVAAARKADEIIVGTRGYGRARALLGSVAHELIHLAECPVTVIPERAVERAEQRAKALVAS